MKPLIAIPCIFALLYRAWSRRSLTPLGLLAAALTATIHALHPSPAPFALLGIFFLIGTAATKVKHDEKARLTLSSSGGGSQSGNGKGGEEARTHVQVLANSGVATVLVLCSVLKFRKGEAEGQGRADCFAYGDGNDLLLVGIVANYAAVAADTLSSELGILSKSLPRLITTGRTVPAGTNGGVTGTGLLAGLGGSFVIAMASALLLPFCPEETTTATVMGALMARRRRGWGAKEKVVWVVCVTLWGALGSALDSLLGAVLQGTVEDKRTGKVVEAAGGTRVLTSKSDPGKSGRILHGSDILDNNQVNFVMAFLMSVGGMFAASRLWNVPVSTILY